MVIRMLGFHNFLQQQIKEKNAHQAQGVELIPEWTRKLLVIFWLSCAVIYIFL